MTKPDVRIYNDPDKVARAFADFLLELCQKEKEHNIALSGGSTPRLLFELLAGEYQKKLPWEKMKFYWGDERCVPPDHPESNYRMTKETLLDKVLIPEPNVHRVLGEAEPAVEAIRYSNEISRFVPEVDDKACFDLIILGMGSDGHTASIFPHEMNHLESRLTCDVATHPESGQKRITLTGPVINNARNVAFLVTGESKKEKADTILNDKPGADSYPAYHVKPRGSLYWFLDKAAFGK